MAGGIARSSLSEDRWPHIGTDELLDLWRRHAPAFIKLDSADEDLPRFREIFLRWLTYKGVVGISAGVSTRIGKRMKIERAHLAYRGPEALTEVALSLFDETAASSRSGPPTPEQLVRVCAETTIDAVQRLLPALSFVVEQATPIGNPVSPMGQIAMVQLRDPFDHGHDPYLGAARVSSGLTEATVKATLSALNRRAEITAELTGL